MDRETNYFLHFSVISANLVSFSIGSAYSWTSPVLPKLHDNVTNPLGKATTTLEDSWITSMLSLGAVLGPFPGALSSEKVGRKTTLLVFTSPMAASHLLCAFAATVELYVLARFLLGLGIGCCLAVLPNFVAEIAEDRNRGLSGCVMGVMMAFGSLYSYVVGPFVSIRLFSVCNLIPVALFYLTFGVFVPESPYFFVSVGDVVKARRSLRKYRATMVEKELFLVVESVEYCKSRRTGGLNTKRGLFIGLGLMFFQQFSGICAVLSYMQTIFHAAGDSIPSHVAVIIIATVAMVTTVTTTQLVDAIGRRLLLIVSTAGCFASLSVLGLFFRLKSTGSDVDSMWWLPIASVVAYIVAYNLALGPLPWTITGELFTSKEKSSGSAMCACACLTLAFAITVSFPTLSETLGLAWCFWTFGGCCAAALLFVLFLVPETGGKSLRDVQELLNAR
ncbi:facilitated trehalose transporter Tret1-like [Cylas formicarius]|uniref:facilitated trehalose transporter Tret1-like n=1 Tax=Cylas formicarius TaxID=197179 RepID=UPI0029585468|nr:facilitated trehalose transporter Tret1-like [Cylas formicarius]XP_060523364.1 facilitated trehalose transporter Tret1-like [Cylas formicarius]XP_060523425.1 facilitated trehalose transporter Tret1-like [Cylas formicarius]